VVCYYLVPIEKKRCTTACKNVLVKMTGVTHLYCCRYFIKDVYHLLVFVYSYMCHVGELPIAIENGYRHADMALVYFYPLNVVEDQALKSNINNNK
jgi:hypothetical protein